MLGKGYIDMRLKPAYGWLPGVFAYVAIPLLFLLVLMPTEPYLNTQSVKFAWLVLALAGISVLTLLIVRSRNRIVLEDYLVFGFALWLTVSYFYISPVNVPDVYWGNMFVLTVYGALRVAMPEYRYLKHVVFILLLCLLFYEAFLGIRQAFRLAPSGHGIYLVTGSFFNPGPFGGYLASLMAVSFAYVLHGYSNFKESLPRIKKGERAAGLFATVAVYGLGCVALTAGAIIFFAVFSRSAMVALFVSSTVVLFMYGPFRQYVCNVVRMKRKAVITASCVLLVVSLCAAGLYYAKKDSADGRMLMWKVSAKTVTHNPVEGSGLGTFAANYAESQADYFEKYPESAYKAVAGVPEYAFNEYLHVASELGVVGLALLLSVIIVAFVNLRQGNDPYAYGLLALAVFALFSYPFSILSLKILLVLYVASSANCRLDENKKRRVSRLALAALTLYGGVVLAFLVPVYQEKVEMVGEWKKAASIAGYDSEYAARDYASLVQWHTDNPAFLFEYGRLHHLNGNYALSNRILSEGAALSADPMFYNVIGNNYKAMGEAALAERSYRKAFDILPNRMYPKYLIMKLYDDNGDGEKARSIAREILSFDVKIESSATLEMQELARDLLENGG